MDTWSMPEEVMAMRREPLFYLPRCALCGTIEGVTYCARCGVWLCPRHRRDWVGRTIGAVKKFLGIGSNHA